ncbi:MAG: glyceraldehyde 3-phosphate dehydrogenase [Rickettsiales bacterium]|jgi:glyceraldehyde 3-phosphate dehydrogenase
MTTRIAINGFGRIGRCVARAIFETNDHDLELVAINGPAPVETQTHLLKYDSIHGRFSKEVSFEGEDKIIINGKEIKFTRQRDLTKLDWKSLNIDIVMECTGAFTDFENASKHINAGAKKVVLSAPSKSENIKTIIYGVNDEKLTNEDLVVSVGSCTTNCLAPFSKILNDTIGIEKGFMTTIHSYTNDQNIVDGSHKDLRRARAAAMSMIPTSTGAAKAIGLAIPELKGKLDGGAIRVPTANVSMVDLNFISTRKTSKEEIHQIIQDAIANDPKVAKTLQFVTEPLVSIDFNHTSHSSCFDSTQTKVMGDNFIKVCAWYDNEWAFSLRMIDIAGVMVK